MKRFVLFLIPLSATLMFGAAQSTNQTHVPGTVSAALQEVLDALPSGEMTTVIVQLKVRADLANLPGQGQSRVARVIRALQATAESSQAPLRAFLSQQQAQGNVSEFTPFWVLNGLSVTANREVILEIAGRDEVESITPDAIDIVQTSPAPVSVEPNVSLIGAPNLWSMGYFGQGVVVASMDTGVDVSHPDLTSQWRGGSNSWYDPYNQHPYTPTDLNGHGTWTMGVVVGGDLSESSIGVAPLAQWIAVKIFNDRGRATATAIHSGFQWLLDPDGNPDTDDAPNVVNNSWAYGTTGCNLSFQPDLQALRAANILPVFAAGNYGPGSSTDTSPANNPEAFAVGATDNFDQIYIYSSRGPSSCGEASTVFPELTAPGAGIFTTDLYGFYTQASGTSLAAPHVAGAIALLLSAFPGLTADQQQDALQYSAIDPGGDGPDNNFGYGRLDVLGAYNCIYAGTCAVPPPPPPPPALTLVCASEKGQVGTVYSSALTASGGVTPYSFSITAGSLPPGITLDSSTGWMTGTPTLSGTYDYTALAADSTAGGAATATADCRITIDPEPPPPSGMHIGDLDGSSSSTKSSWSATVRVEAHTDAHVPLSDVTITGTWSGGASGTASCTTDINGSCQMTSGTISKKNSSVTFTITGAAKTNYSYKSSENHDPDGDSNGTVITVSK